MLLTVHLMLRQVLHANVPGRGPRRIIDTHDAVCPGGPGDPGPLSLHPRRNAGPEKRHSIFWGLLRSAAGA